MSLYHLRLEAEVHTARKQLPGNIRQRIKRAIDSLANEPRPSNSDPLELSEVELPPLAEVRRLRMKPWRIVYAVNDAEGWVWILAVRRRPPYAYEDLNELMNRLR